MDATSPSLCMADHSIGLIGAGQMARALASGLVGRRLVEPGDITAYDPVGAAQSQFLREVPGARWGADNAAVVRQSDVVILAVKPQSFSAVVAELEEVDTGGKLFLSILAGVNLAALYRGLRTRRVVRIMPNTPCLIGRGAAGYALGEGATEGDGKLVASLLGAVGTAHALPEKLLDAVTGLSGSGPAYVYLMIEALSDGGVRMGLPRSVAIELAAQTVMGAAELVLQSGEHPGALKDRVASPAGTTIAGLQILERRAVRAALIDAVEAATVRSQELGSQG
jgi:pyrroline-5-carboxylate reductase